MLLLQLILVIPRANCIIFTTKKTTLVNTLRISIILLQKKQKLWKILIFYGGKS